MFFLPSHVIYNLICLLPISNTEQFHCLVLYTSQTVPSLFLFFASQVAHLTWRPISDLWWFCWGNYVLLGMRIHLNSHLVFANTNSFLINSTSNYHQFRKFFQFWLIEIDSFEIFHLNRFFIKSFVIFRKSLSCELIFDCFYDLLLYIQTNVPTIIFTL